MTAFTYRMGAGIPGAISRNAAQATVEPAALNSAAPFLAYGGFGKTVAEKFVPVANGDAGAVIEGMLVRPFPTTSSQDPLSTSTPPTSGVGDKLKRGYISVLLKGAVAAAKDAQVYVVTTAGGGLNVGDIVAQANQAGSTTVVPPQTCLFTGPADANGVTEVAFNI